MEFEACRLESILAQYASLGKPLVSPKPQQNMTKTTRSTPPPVSTRIVYTDMAKLMAQVPNQQPIRTSSFMPVAQTLSPVGAPCNSDCAISVYTRFEDHCNEDFYYDLDEDYDCEQLNMCDGDFLMEDLPFGDYDEEYLHGCEQLYPECEDELDYLLYE